MTNSSQLDVLGLYREAGALHEGHFLLASGRHSPKFLQSTTLTQYPHYTAQLAAGLAEQLRERGIQAALTVGPAMGGVVPAYEVARALGLRSIFAEKDGQGGMKIREAFSLAPAEPFIAIEDVLTTGGSVMKAVQAAEAAGGRCAAIACIIDRRDPSSDPQTLNGYPLVSLSRIHFDTYAPDDLPDWLAAIPLQEI
ncbi:orotate phosphoribosyltransferase [Deinococcus radiophilus]|uniref:Orotate phosphoribosyltransferase n=1 Tax=Deinococcus radiophilus TaxID=32062 RepID=A0A3S0I8G0_9DEIO|nr:orotate phosphoribosyltransferase [Deinococcus radiophilus]RTR29843.1 orotate phosphoribosyltransferase [Deinococcus radiophilus]UFA49807.1 orotate phosphoribosyltransferase [Deinococcus radiophilus]